MFGFGLFAGLFGLVFKLAAIIIVAVFIIILVKGIKVYKSNNKAPRLTVDAYVSGKRADVSSTRHFNAGDISGAHGSYTTDNTTYHVTFQVESGDRLEFTVSGSEYGSLMQGDQGRLTFQGTRYLGFERQLMHYENR